MMILQKLQAMDIVLRRDGTVCWVLKDNITGRLRLFGLDLYGFQLLRNYNYDFTYGKDVALENLDEIECENLRNFDIIAVSGLNSDYEKLWITRNYEKSLLMFNEEGRDRWFRAFNWRYTDAYFGKNTYSGD